MTALAHATRASAPASLGPTMLLLLTAAGVFAVFWGFLNPPKIEVVSFDAGNVSQFAIHKVVAYPDRALYLVGLDDGRIRAIDGRVEASGCRVNWLPDDPRGAVRNPAGLPGVFEDPCSRAVWSFEGNAISGADQPLRTPHVQPTISQDGKSAHISVELINPSK